MVLTVHALPHVMGYLATKAGEAASNPLSMLDLAATADELGLSGIDAGVSSLDEAGLDALIQVLAQRNQRFLAEYGVVTGAQTDTVRDVIVKSAALGAKVLRVMISGVLCGDRRSLEGGWDALLHRTAQRLRELLPFAGDLGICLAVENHQDATSDDLLCLAEMVGGHPAFGVTLDTGNALAVGEDPVEYARRVNHLIRHAHLKDYTIHFAPQGYRLVRCAAGDGVVDFPSILKGIRANGHDVNPGIEVAAQSTRTIPMLSSDWWACYPEKQVSRLISALNVLWSNGRPVDEPYSSAWERGEPSTVVADEEWRVLRRSVEYFKNLSRA